MHKSDRDASGIELYVLLDEIINDHAIASCLDSLDTVPASVPEPGTFSESESRSERLDAQAQHGRTHAHLCDHGTVRNSSVAAGPIFALRQGFDADGISVNLGICSNSASLFAEVRRKYKVEFQKFGNAAEAEEWLRVGGVEAIAYHASV